MRKINRILKQNHSILEELNPEGKTTTYKSKLEKQGFNFNYYTKYLHHPNRKSLLFLLRSGLCRTGEQ